MGKALLVFSDTAAIVSGNFTNVFGAGSGGAEANATFSVTQNATFSALGFNITSGGGGTNTLQARIAAGDGTLVAARTGQGVASDTTHSDVITAGNTFGLAATDDGASPGYRWIKANVEFASGHGNFHAAASYGGPVFDVASATRYLPVGGAYAVDGQTVEANAAFKNRAYDTVAAFQVRVLANARTNDSVFKVRVDGADAAGATITFAAAETGLKTVTGLSVAITDGQTIGASITLLTGVEDITVAFIGVTLTSAAGASETWCGSTTGVVRAASATSDYYPIGGGIALDTGENNVKLKPGFAGVAKNLRCYLSANTYSVNATLKLFRNAVAVLTTTLTASGGAAWYENTADTVAFDDNDELSFEIVGGTTGSITVHMVGVTLGATVAATGTIGRAFLD